MYGVEARVSVSVKMLMWFPRERVQVEKKKKRSTIKMTDYKVGEIKIHEGDRVPQGVLRVRGVTRAHDR